MKIPMCADLRFDCSCIRRCVRGSGRNPRIHFPRAQQAGQLEALVPCCAWQFGLHTLVHHDLDNRHVHHS